MGLAGYPCRHSCSWHSNSLILVMDFVQSIIGSIIGIVSSILLPLIGVFLFYDSRKRKEEAAASKEEALACKEVPPEAEIL